jgi:hypothetical protein
VSKVEFYVDNVLKYTTTASPFAYSWDTTPVPNGSHALTAKAYDPSNNIGISQMLTVTVSNVDTTAPTLSITTPANGVSVSGSVNITASASDFNGISKVEFYVDNVLKYTDTTSPYSYSWDPTQNALGSHILTAKAYDLSNNVGTSQPVAVTFNGPLSIASPAAGATVSGTVNVTVASIYTPLYVDFYVDGVVANEDLSSPFVYSWNTQAVANGVHRLKFMLEALDGTDYFSPEISVTVSNGGGAPSLSILPIGDQTVQANLDIVKVFPNPWRANLHGGRPVTFDNMTAGSTIKIFTIAAQWVKTLTADGSGKAAWDLTNDSGQAVASGSYFYLITNAQGQKTRGHLAVIR